MALSERRTQAGRARSDFVSAAWSAAAVMALALVGAVAIIRAVNKPLWFDEIFTLILARMHSPREIIQALWVPVDAMPPPYYLICRATLHLVPDDHLGIRLPSVCGLLVALACTHVFLATRVDRISALTGAAFLACTCLADYAFEARPYALMIGLMCAATCCWQRIDRSWAWTIGLASALALAVSCHYYAIFAWPAFGIAEAVIFLCERRIRMRVWLALAVGTLPFIACWPLLANFRDAYGGHWWSVARFSLVFSAPQVLLKWSGGMWGPAVTGALAVLCTAWILQAFRPCSRAVSARFPPSPLSPGESGLALGFLAVPVIAVIAARLSHGGMTERYMMPMVIGAALAIGGLTSLAPRAFRLIALAIMLVDYGLTARLALSEWSKGHLMHARADMQSSCEDYVTTLGDTSSPIVLANAFTAMQASLYSHPDDRQRTWSVVDPEAAIAFSSDGSNVCDKSLLAIRPYADMQVRGYDDFLETHDSFLVCCSGSEWLLAKLLHDGHELTLVSRSRWGLIYRVIVKRRPQPPRPPDAGGA